MRQENLPVKKSFMHNQWQSRKRKQVRGSFCFTLEKTGTKKPKGRSIPAGDLRQRASTVALARKKGCITQEEKSITRAGAKSTREPDVTHSDLLASAAMQRQKERDGETEEREVEYQKKKKLIRKLHAE